MAPGGANENIFSFRGTRALAVCWRLHCKHASTAGPAWTARPDRTDRAEWQPGTIRATGRSGANWGNRRSGADRSAGRHGPNRPDGTAGPAPAPPAASAQLAKHNPVFDTFRVGQIGIALLATVSALLAVGSFRCPFLNASPDLLLMFFVLWVRSLLF